MQIYVVFLDILILILQQTFLNMAFEYAVEYEFGKSISYGLHNVCNLIQVQDFVNSCWRVMYRCTENT